MKTWKVAADKIINIHVTELGSDTASRVERFVAGRGNVERTALPLPQAIGSVGRSSRLVYLRSQVGHMELVTEGRAILEVLRLTPLPGGVGG